MKHLLVVLTGLLFTSATIHTMEITEKDFVFKKKEQSFLSSRYATDDCELPDFANKKDLDRTFANHELLWSHTMNAQEILSDHLINSILKIRYRQIIDNKYEGKITFCFYPLRIGVFNYDYYKYPKDIFWANKGQQKVIYHLMNTERTPENNLIIEGANVQFSRETAKQIDSLPASIKQKLCESSHNVFYIQTNEPTFLNAYLEEKKTRENIIERLSFVAHLLIRGTFIIVFLYVYIKISNTDFKQGLKLGAAGVLIGTALKRVEGIEGAVGAIMGMGAVLGGTKELVIGLVLGAGMPGALIVGDIITGTVTKNIIHACLEEESIDGKMAMRGFEKRYFFLPVEDKK